METKYYKATLYDDGTFEVSEYKGDATTQDVYRFFNEEKSGVYAIRQSKKAAINAIRKRLEKRLIAAKEEVENLEKTLLQLK